jgi:hypothetical protein
MPEKLIPKKALKKVASDYEDGKNNYIIFYLL